MDCHEDKLTFLVLTTHLIGKKLGLNFKIALNECHTLNFDILVFPQFLLFYLSPHGVQRILLVCAALANGKLSICNDQ